MQDKKYFEIDKENLRQVILDFPDQFAKGLQLAENIKVSGTFKNVVVSGMGGSSLPVDALRTYLNSLYSRGGEIKEFELMQNRTYSLPRQSYIDCLNIFSSYSGTTEETLSSLREAIENNLPSIGIAAGGKLIEICQKNNIPCVILPDGIQPRYAIGYFFAAMYKILANAGLVPDKTGDFSKLSEELKQENPRLEKEGLEIAQQLTGRTPIIYASDKFKALAMIWKIKINENAKTPAFYNSFPELTHNEMVGFTLPQGKFHVVTLLDRDDHPQNIKRLKITADLMKGKGIDTTIIEMENSNVLNTIFATLLLGDWASYHLALKYEQDPTPVKMVEDLKKLLA